jgi:hypothetical protein
MLSVHFTTHLRTLIVFHDLKLPRQQRIKQKLFRVFTAVPYAVICRKKIIFLQITFYPVLELILERFAFDSSGLIIKNVVEVVIWVGATVQVLERNLDLFVVLNALV